MSRSRLVSAVSTDKTYVNFLVRQSQPQSQPGRIGSLELCCCSDALVTDRIPIYLRWLNDNTLLLADSIASIWIYRVARNSAGSYDRLVMVYEGRLENRGTCTVEPREDLFGVCFVIGNHDIAVTYRLKETADDKVTIDTVSCCCLGEGNVRQVSRPFLYHVLCDRVGQCHLGSCSRSTSNLSHRLRVPVKQSLETQSGRRQYLCTTNTSASIFNDAGDKIASIVPALSSTSTMRVIRERLSGNYSFFMLNGSGVSGAPSRIVRTFSPSLLPSPFQDLADET